MLQLILGRASTGKSYKVFENIKTDVLIGKSVVLLVPEQFTFECERTLLHTLGDKNTTNAQVLSFTRLYDEVARKIGGRVADTVTDGDKIILMGQALKSVASELVIWKKYVDSPRFISAFMVCVNELKASAISPDALFKAAEVLPDSFLKNKAKETALIYGAYNSLLGNRFIDPQDNGDRLYHNLLKYEFFKGKTVYIDSFKSFTGQQYKILDRILFQADTVTLCSTTPDLDYDKLDVFTSIRKTVQNIIKIAEKNHIEVSKPIILNDFHYKNDSLCKIESIFSDRHSVEYSSVEKGITVCCAQSVFDEAEFAARTIRRLVRTENYRYKDFVIITRTAEKYQTAVENACKKNGVFCFSDKRKSINYMPLTVLINSYFKLLTSYNTEAILSMLKTELGPVSGEQVNLLENYTYIWNINGFSWQENWDMNPEGFKEGISERSKATLELINSCREKVVNSVESFKRSFCGTPADMAAAVVRLLQKLKVSQKLKDNYCSVDVEPEEAEDMRQSYEVVMQILDGIVKCLPEKATTANEFINNWDMAVGCATFGNIPQMLDEVTFGAADRIKPSRPKVAFILGANEGEFPRSVKTQGIFADNERRRLNELGLELFTNDLTAAIEEDYLVYTSLCCPTEKLYVCYNTSAVSGASTEPSEIVTNIIDSLGTNAVIVNEPDFTLTYNNLPETDVTATSRMCSAYNNNKQMFATLEAAVSRKNGITVNGYLEQANKQITNLSPSVAKQLYGKNISLSATKFDTFQKCRFYFFCKYGIRAKKLEPAEFSNLQRGTIVHFVLEKIIKEYGKGIGELTRQQCDEKVDGYIKEYLSLIEGVQQFMNARMRYLVSKISELVKDVAFHLVREFSQTDFVPSFCELKIGNDGYVPTKTITADNGTSFNINGSIDRVDLWNGYVRVVDYKTGTKNFSLSDVLVGLNVQMLIYLYSLVKGENEEFNSLSSAGILYAPSKREKDDNNLAMNGIIVDNDEVINAMEKENAGEFIPKHEYKKDGNLKGSTYVSPEVFEVMFGYVEKLIRDMGTELEKGKIPAIPTDTSNSKACKYCDYYSVCCLEKGEHIKVETLTNAQALEKMKEVL